MKNVSKETFIGLYRDEIDIKNCNRMEVEQAIEKTDLLRRSYTAGIGINVLGRQSGLTEDEIKNISQNADKVISRLERKKKISRKRESIKEEEVYLRLLENKEYVIKRLLDGDERREIVESLGIPHRGNAFLKFTRDMRTQGYLIHDLPKFNKIMIDVDSGKPLSLIVDKYRNFKSEKDVIRFLDIHGVPIETNYIEQSKVCI